jgi:hypothetical protein
VTLLPPGRWPHAAVHGLGPKLGSRHARHARRSPGLRRHLPGADRAAQPGHRHHRHRVLTTAARVPRKVAMTRTRPGWQPHSQPGDQHLSWQHLADTWPRCRGTTFRRFWNGSRWEGSRIPNADLRAIAACPGRKRQTGFTALTAEEENRYMAGSIATGSMLLSNRGSCPSDFSGHGNQKTPSSALTAVPTQLYAHPASNTTLQLSASGSAPDAAKSSCSRRQRFRARGDGAPRRGPPP